MESLENVFLSWNCSSQLFVQCCVVHVFKLLCPKLKIQ